MVNVPVSESFNDLTVSWEFFNLKTKCWLHFDIKGETASPIQRNHRKAHKLARINISFILRVGVWRGRRCRPTLRAGAAQDNKFTYFTPQTDLFCHSAELRTYGNILLNISAVRRYTPRIKLSPPTHLRMKSRNKIG